MRVRVRLVRPFKDAVGQPVVEFEPAQRGLLGAVQELVGLYPGLREHLLEGPRLSAYVNVYRNGQAVRADEAADVALRDGDELMFLLPMTGG